MFIRFAALSLVLLFACQTRSRDDTFKPTKFVEDVKTLKLEHLSSSPDRKHFLAVFYDESRSMSGIKVVKLYNRDSLSVDEVYYGAHLLEVNKWSDSGIVFNAGVFSAHGDPTIRKSYLDGSVDRNALLGKYHLYYQKDYDYRPK